LAVEVRHARRVDVEPADVLAAYDDGHDDLGARPVVAGDVPGELVDVGDDLRAPLGRRGAAHAAPHGDADAGGPPLEGAEHQLPALHQVEAGPVHVLDVVVDRRGDVG